MSFEIGDRVWDVRHGFGVVVSTTGFNVGIIDFPLVAEFIDVGKVWYTLEGRDEPEDAYPLLYHKGTQLVVAPEPVRCPFKEYDRVLVRDFSGQAWKITLFKNFHPEAETGHKYHTYGCPSCGGDDTSIFCIPFEGNEHLIGTK